ncbi:hypothetical protein ACFPPD_09045 [Cohnella suwonensis]|uniref:Holin n=1 Tax=Cohnella suwonensis TaxID=696072 RepID=A0ABW0LSI3_9BACL
MGKMILLILIYAAIWIADKQKLKKLGGRGIVAYAAMLLLSLYLGIDYALDLKWPFIEDAASFLLGTTAGRIVKLLTVPS